MITYVMLYVMLLDRKRDIVAMPVCRKILRHENIAYESNDKIV
jgi:hypothetical protein